MLKNKKEKEKNNILISNFKIKLISLCCIFKTIKKNEH